MGNFNFYAPDRMPIERDKFLDLYSKRYYLCSEKLSGANGKAVGQNSKITEDEINKILKKGIRNEIDVVHILAWKIGKIKHKESQAQDKFVYAKDWKNAQNFDVKRYGKTFDMKQIAEFIVKYIGELERQATEDPQGVLNRLRDQNFSGLGSVYLITLLYFISRGKYPIYDRFAQMALYAICNNKKPGDIVEYNELPERQSRAFANVMNEDMKEYIRQMESVFGKTYRDSRKIDQALWVYGHLFKSEQKEFGKQFTCREENRNA